MVNDDLRLYNRSSVTDLVVDRKSILDPKKRHFDKCDLDEQYIN